MDGKEKITQFFSRKFDLLALLITYGVFNILLFNKFFPVTEGWFQDFSTYMLEGQVPYRDFYLFIPPLFPMLMSLISKISNNLFVVFRAYGIIERLILISIVYFILKRISFPKTVFISLLTAGIVYISNIQDLFYGYYQTSLLLAMLIVLFTIRTYEGIATGKYRSNAILMGFFTALTILCKHTTGVILYAAMICSLVVVSIRTDRRKGLLCALISSASCVIFLFIGLLPIIFTGAFLPMMDQLFWNASSKGSIVNVLFGFLLRITNSQPIFYFFIALFAIAVNWIYGNKSCFKEEGTWTKEINYLAALGVLAMIYFFGYKLLVSSTLSRYQTEPARQITMIFLMILISCVILAFANIRKYPEDVSIYPDKVYPWGIALISVCLCVLFIYISTYGQPQINWYAVRKIRQVFSYSIFFLLVFLSLFIAFDVLVWRRDRYTKLLILLIASCSIIYIHGMSNIIEDHAMLLGLALFVSILIDLSSPMHIIKNLAIYVSCIVLIGVIFVQRCEFPYHWWGVNAIQPIYQSTEKYDDPNLFGIYGSEESTKTLNAIYSIIENTKQPGDTMFSFPHISYFNVMSDLRTDTFAKTHFFDVCSDEIAIKDAEFIRNNNPTYIVWMELQEEAWTVHEELFRDGQPSGQRAFRKVYRELLWSGKYGLLYRGRIAASDPIYVWRLVELPIEDTAQPNISHWCS